MTFADWGLLLLLSFLWGGAFFFSATAVQELPPFTVVISRTGLAAIALAIILRSRREDWRINKQMLPCFFILGFLNNMLPFSLLFWAQTMIPSGVASILNATTPIFTIIVAHYLLADEPLSANKVIGIGFGLFGVIVLLSGNLLTGQDFALMGMIACLGAALSYGFAGVYARRFKSMGLSATQVAFGQLTGTTILMVPIVTLVDQPWTLPTPSIHIIASLVALAVISTAFAYIIFFRLLGSAGAVNTALVTLLIPASAILLGAIFLNETLYMHHYLGMALISIGLLAIDGRALKYMMLSE
jgi:drug/metabolite transporter (DMT)-like permease